MRSPAAHASGKRPRAYVAFSGGGAKGILHIGALKALEEEKVEFRGLAGTSIGAVVAALKAAGYTANDIANPISGASLMRRISEIDACVQSPTDFFGAGRWPLIWLGRSVYRRPWVMALALLAIALYPAYALWLAMESPADGPGVLQIWILGVAVILGMTGFVLNGLGSVSRFKRVLNTLLHEKMLHGEPKRAVLMGDFDGKKRPSLKIVASNLTGSRMELFCNERTPKVSVVDAVAASMSLPLVFRLPRVNLKGDATERGDLFTDGGIVSNLPAWPFDEERELDPEALTIAVDIPDLTQRRAPGRFTWVPSLLRTGFFGGSELDKRASNSMIQLPLQADIGLLAFDMPRDRMFKIVAEATAVSKIVLARTLRDPHIFVLACEDLQKNLVEAAQTSPIVFPNGVGRVRVAIAQQDEGYKQSLRLRHCVNYGEDADQLILLPIDGSVCGKAFDEGQPRLEKAFGKYLEGDENKHVRRLIHKDLKWIFCVPIFAPDGSTRFVACFDGESELSDTDETVDFFKEIATTSQANLGHLLLSDSDNA